RSLDALWEVRREPNHQPRSHLGGLGNRRSGRPAPQRAGGHDSGPDLGALRGLSSGRQPGRPSGSGSAARLPQARHLLPLQQLVPEAWVRQSTSMITPSAGMNPPAMRAERVGYGYLWWVPEVESGNPLVGSYAARGAYGQYILVAPKLDLVVAHQRAVEDRE